MLQVTDLRLGFVAGKALLAAVDGVSFAVSAGETFSLLGESGCGKSVTAQGIMRLLPPAGHVGGGSVRLAGEELLTLPEAEMRRLRGARMAMIFQEPATSLNPVMTVGDQIGEVLARHLGLRGEPARQRMLELLRRVGIADPERRLGEYPFQFSGGMKQRVMIAIALAGAPALLIADEPTTALDVTVQAQILDLLREMKRTFDLSLLLITHDLGIVARVADRVAVMYAGRIVETGPAPDVLRSPRHPYTRGLLASLPGHVPGTRLEAIPGAVPDLAALPPGCAFAPRCPDRFEACDGSRPDAYVVSPGRTARCFLHGGAAR